LKNITLPSENVMKVAHIVSDEKFIDRHIDKYKDSGFENSFFYFRDEYKYKGKYEQQLTHIQPGSSSYQDLVKGIEAFDMVIFYFLQRNKIALLNDIQGSKVIIVWSFYGAELYSLPRMKYKMLSRETLKLLNWDYFNLGRLGDLRTSITNLFKNEPTDDQLIKKAVPQVDYFLWYNPYEYDFLNSLFHGKLPAFIPSSVTNVTGDIVPNKDKSNSVVVGNARSFYNNHIDAIGLLKECHFKGKVSIPFSYGFNPRYARKLKSKASSSGLDIKFIEDFVPVNEYIDDLNRHCAAVYPSFRQIGLGNVLIAIRCGLKVYLSERNPTLPWLRDLGFAVFSVDKDLARDVVNDDLRLDDELMDLNSRAYSQMTDKKNDLAFFDKLKRICLEHKAMRNDRGGEGETY
jgi:dTDP-N-acetylfucosamine:lipid II N-acetylfucosaminyltransferase